MNEHQKFYKEVTRQVRQLRRQIGKNIHAVRMQRGMTLEKLARLSRMRADTIDRLEMGKGEIDLIHIVRLATVMKIEIENLFHQPKPRS